MTYVLQRLFQLLSLTTESREAKSKAEIHARNDAEWSQDGSSG